MMRTVGLVGLGLLGSALASRMLGAGMRVVGFDLEAERRQQLVAAGGEAAESAALVARQCDVVVLSLPDSNVVAKVIGVLEGELRSGMIIVDTSTGDPLATEALAAQLAECGIAYLDATIGGSSTQVYEGTAMVMVGGSPGAVEAAGEVLGCFGRQMFHVGPAGSGARMKLVVNLVLGLNRAVLAEGLTLAGALGLDLAAALEVLRGSPAYSTVMDTKGVKMLRGDFAPQARLSQHLKDVRLMLAAAERTGTELPLSVVHRTLLERAEAAGCGELDNSAILRAFEK